MKPKIFVIIGAGPAGVSAAEYLREKENNAEIIVISNEDFPYYVREHIINYVDSSESLDDLFEKGRDFFNQKRIDFRVGEVIRIDPEKKEVWLKNGEHVRYNRLLIATGGTPKKLGLPGEDLKGIFHLYTLYDAILFKNKLPEISRIVIVGGGTVALKLIRALLKTKKNIDITIVENRDALLFPVIDKQGGKLIEAYLDERAVKSLTEREVIRFEEKKGHVARVSLKNSLPIDTDVVVICIGIQPNVGFLKGRTINFNKGIVVNKYLETSVTDIFAAGDVVEGPDPLCHQETRVHPSWKLAKLHGKIAAQNMLGQKISLDEHIHLQKISLLDLGFISAGVFHENKQHKIYQKCTPSSYFYRKLVYDEEKLVGIIFLQMKNKAFPMKRVKNWAKELLLTQPNYAKDADYLLTLDFENL